MKLEDLCLSITELLLLTLQTEPGQLGVPPSSGDGRLVLVLLTAVTVKVQQGTFSYNTGNSPA